MWFWPYLEIEVMHLLFRKWTEPHVVCQRDLKIARSDFLTVLNNLPYLGSSGRLFSFCNNVSISDSWKSHHDDNWTGLFSSARQRAWINHESLTCHVGNTSRWCLTENSWWDEIWGGLFMLDGCDILSPVDTSVRNVRMSMSTNLTESMRYCIKY